MKISIPSSAIVADYNSGTPIFPEAWFTINEWLTKGRIQAEVPSFDNGNSLFQDGNSIYTVTKESLNDIRIADGIVYDNPFVWQADLAIFDLLMPTSIPAARIPTGGTAEFPNIVAFTSTGTAVKTVGEWIDSQCEVWKNDVLGEVQIFTNPINNLFLEFHLNRAFVLEFTIANHGSLSKDTEYLDVDNASDNRDLDPTNWIKQQPN